MTALGPTVARGSYGSRVIATLPLLVAAAVYAVVSGSAVVATLVLAAALLALAVAPLIDVPRFVQRATLLLVLLFGGLGGAAALTALEPEVKTRPSELRGRLAVTALLLVATRRFFREPEGGMRPDFALCTLALVLCGQRHVGPIYVAAVPVFVVTIVLVVRSRDAGAGWSVVEANTLAATVAVLAVVALSATVGMLALPRIAVLTESQFERFVLPHASQVGFTERLQTGSPDRLNESEEVALRVYGPHVDYLRGRVYDLYDHGSWLNTPTPPGRVVATAVGVPAGAGVTEIRGVGALQRADPQSSRFFVPLGAGRFATARGVARVDVFGVLRPDPDDPPTPIGFEAGASEYEVAPPGAADLRVPDDLRPTLEPIALDWTRGATTPRAKVQALESHLTHDFAYTLDGIAPSHEQAIVHFLRVSHRGRCELFATALALMARTVGVPTRVVGGFRVTEHNVVGGYDVVREKNAHAWVEAWVGGRAETGEAWRTFDGTPATEANLARERRDLAALGDAALALWDRALELLGRASLWQFGVLLGGAVALLTAVRLLRARRDRLRNAMGQDAEGVALPYFARLESALAARGHARSPSEPLEWYAERLKHVHESAAVVVLEYSALRYGGIGDPDAVAERALSCAREIEAAPPVPGPSPPAPLPRSAGEG